LEGAAHDREQLGVVAQRPEGQPAGPGQQRHPGLRGPAQLDTLDQEPQPGQPRDCSPVGDRGPHAGVLVPVDREELAVLGPAALARPAAGHGGIGRPEQGQAGLDPVGAGADLQAAHGQGQHCLRWAAEGDPSDDLAVAQGHPGPLRAIPLVQAVEVHRQRRLEAERGGVGE
jgi:hypothetical protein